MKQAEPSDDCVSATENITDKFQFLTRFPFDNSEDPRAHDVVLSGEWKAQDMKIIKAGSSTVAKACYRAGDALVFDLRLQEAGVDLNIARLHWGWHESTNTIMDNPVSGRGTRHGRLSTILYQRKHLYS